MKDFIKALLMTSIAVMGAIAAMPPAERKQCLISIGHGLQFVGGTIGRVGYSIECSAYGVPTMEKI